jgi:4-alpha-glucanotransferase
MPLELRRAGLLLHPTSLPGRFGIGDLGPEAFRFLDWLRDAGLAYWQILPLGPTSYGDSPYQCFSAFAGNPLLVSPEFLVRDGLLKPEDIEPPPFPANKVDYGWVINWKRELLGKAHRAFASGAPAALKTEYGAFVEDEIVKTWLEDYALFMACKDAHGGRAWNEWDPDLCAYKSTALATAREMYAEDIAYHRFAQFLFFHQWGQIRAACRERKIEIIGDAPIYVAYDSADTWAHQKNFKLGKGGLPTHVAGVPPDYFSATGQLWGNPLYQWDRMKRDKYAWWIARLKANLALVDILRVDHFRGFMGYYAIPFGSKTAETGEWMKGPGSHFFKVVKEALGRIPIIAEDLGEITSDVEEVRDEFHLPGMKILQFAWTVDSLNPIIPDQGHPFIPHRYERNTIVYTGTHDNDTTIGWWRHSSQPAERTCMQVYLSTDGNMAHWDLLRAAYRSVANTAIVPAQDLLGLDSDSRMNFPGKAEGNWTWRLREGELDADLARHIYDLTLLYDRCNNPPPQFKKAVKKPPPY